MEIKDYSVKLRTIRKAIAVDQKTMADVMSVSQSTYSRFESNQGDISANSLQGIFDQLQVSPLWFFSNIEPMFLPIMNESQKIEISKLIQTHTIIFELRQKIKTQGERTFWENIVDSFEGAFELFTKALGQDFSKITIQNAKKTLIDTIEKIPINRFGFGINTYETDRQKLLNFINELEDIECLVILTNAQQILVIINQSRMSLNRRS